MGKIITIANQKGGVGKSTTAYSIAMAYREKKKKVLLVDMDGQCNLTTLMKVAREGIANTTDLLMNIKSAKESIIKTDTVDLIPSNPCMANIDVSLANVIGREYRLRNQLNEVKDNYDYIIIDTPPAVSNITINALTAADEVIIPTLADSLCLQGVAQILDTIKMIVNYTENKNLKVNGIVITKYNPRTTVTKYIEEELNSLAKENETKVFNTKIRESVAVRESQTLIVNLLEEYSKATASEDYRNLIKEI